MGLIIDSYNFSTNFQFIKPSFVLLILIYWNMALPDKVGITTVSFIWSVDRFAAQLLAGPSWVAVCTHNVSLSEVLLSI